MPNEELALAARAITLYQIEDDLAALLNSIDMAPEDQQLACLDAITEATTLAKAKRDNVARYLRTLDAMQDAVGHEIDWLKGRRNAIKRHTERVKAYVSSLVEQYAPDAPDSGKKNPRLEGNVFTLALAKNPDSVEITGAALVPDRFVTLTLEMPATFWSDIEKALTDEQFRLVKQTRQLRKSDIKKALDAGEEVPGADRKFGAYRLEVR